MSAVREGRADTCVLSFGLRKYIYLKDFRIPTELWWIFFYCPVVILPDNALARIQKLQYFVPEPLCGFNMTSLARIQKRAKNILYPSHCVAEHRPNRHGRVGGRWVGRMTSDLFTEPLFESSNSISYHVNAARMVHFITSTLPSGQLVVSPLAGRIRSGPQRDTWREQFRKYQGCNNWRLASLRINYTWQPGPGPWS